jgi:transcriptional regulator with GAF, ATPase, and Fis domain
MAAPTRATVLLQGESGTGKELFARALHDQSDRREKPFIQLNCAALPEGLIESSLFGHEKGAFTGAIKRVEGAFERAHRGTLLLDEISEMRLDLQAKLLRVLQEQEFERVGGTSPIKVDVRIIATTNRDLAAEVEEGTFRQDLYYRLSTIPIQIPPLRDRLDDVPVLALRFAMRVANDLGKKIEGFSPDALRALQEYQWPGNVRELQHVIERAVILTPDPIIQPHCLEGTRFGLAHSLNAPGPRGPRAAAMGVNGGGGFTPAGSVASVQPVKPGSVVLDTLDVNEAERVLIGRALEASGGNRTKAAELLGMSVRTLRNKLNGPGGKGDEEDVA